MDRCLPLVEHIALRGAQDFSMIGTYTKKFKNCDKFAEALLSEELEVKRYSHFFFFCCPSGVYGKKPNIGRELEKCSDKV